MESVSINAISKIGARAHCHHLDATTLSILKFGRLFFSYFFYRSSRCLNWAGEEIVDSANLAN